MATCTTGSSWTFFDQRHSGSFGSSAFKRRKAEGAPLQRRGQHFPQSSMEAAWESKVHSHSNQCTNEAQSRDVFQAGTSTPSVMATAKLRDEMWCGCNVVSEARHWDVELQCSSELLSDSCFLAPFCALQTEDQLVAWELLGGIFVSDVSRETHTRTQTHNNQQDDAPRRHVRHGGDRSLRSRGCGMVCRHVLHGFSLGGEQCIRSVFET